MNKYLIEARTRTFIALAAAMLIGWWLGGVLGVPNVRGVGGSLLLQEGSAILDLLAVLVILVIAATVGTLICARVRWDAGVAFGAAALASLSLRGGTMQQTLLNHVDAGAGVFAWLALEVTALFVAVIAVWKIALHFRPHLPAEREPIDLVRDSDEDKAESLDQKLLGLACSAMVTAVGVAILCQSQDKTQCLAALFIASLAGAWCGHQFVPSGPSLWYFLAPLPVALVGYLTAAFNPGPDFTIGFAGGWVPALARPLPLDYASAGVVGGMYGYYLSRSSRRARHETPETLEAEAAHADHTLPGEQV